MFIEVLVVSTFPAQYIKRFIVDTLHCANVWPEKMFSIILRVGLAQQLSRRWFGY